MNQIVKPTVDADEIGDGSTGEDGVSSQAASLMLMREIAHRSLTRVREAVAEPDDHGRSLPLPIAPALNVTIGQALEAAFFNLELLKKRAEGELSGESDPLDWAEASVDPVEAPIAARALARK